MYVREYVFRRGRRESFEKEKEKEKEDLFIIPSTHPLSS
jgi:hypothetical protein